MIRWFSNFVILGLFLVECLDFLYDYIGTFVGTRILAVALKIPMIALSGTTMYYIGVYSRHVQ